MNKLTMSVEGDAGIVATRRFNAPPEAVYRSHLNPDVVSQWLLGPPGWTMPACVIEPWPGGRMRYEWSNAGGGDFHLTGEYVELEAPRRIVHVERMHLPGTTPDNQVETLFELDGQGTLMTIRMSLPDEATRAAMLSSGMESGMEASYARLDALTWYPG